MIKGFARSYDGVGPQANRGFYYLNPFLSTSRRVFGELNSDQAALESLIVDAASLTEALAARSPDLEQLVGNLNGMMGAIGRRETELASAIGQLPDFMRQFNTTAVNLRAALDDVDPLVDASKPVARKLQPFARKLRGFARDAVPTIKGLDGIVTRKGAANDLIELTQLQVPLAEIGVGPVNRNGATPRRARCRRPAQAPAPTACPAALLLPPLHHRGRGRGWFDDFGHSGVPDAIGGIGRISHHLQRLLALARPAARPEPASRRPSLDLAGARCSARSTSTTCAAAPAPTSATPATARPRSPTTARSTATRARCRRAHEADRAHTRRAARRGRRRWSRPPAPTTSSTYQAELFNAFGLVEGSELRVAGVKAGTVTDLDITAEKTALVSFEVGPEFPEFKADASCSSEPQSLIAEYFLDCQPGQLATSRSRGRSTPPRNQTTVQNDLVQNTLREPFKRRLQLIINEFGTALAGNAENLNAAIRAGAPALRELRKVLKILGRQNTIIAELNANSDAIFARLTDRREDVVRFIDEAEDTARISAERREDLARDFDLLDDFLFELQPGHGRARQPRPRADAAADRPQAAPRA